MNAYLGTVSNVDADARMVRVSLPHLRVQTGWLRVGSVPGLVLPLPAVGDEVSVQCTSPGFADAYVSHWFPTTAQVVAAASHPLVTSADGGLPTQVDPSQVIGNAALSGVLTR